VIVLPLFTASIAYWVGSQGTTEAKEETKKAQNQLKAVLDASDGGVLDRAQQANPAAFAP